MATSQNGWPVYPGQGNMVAIPKVRGRFAPEVAPVFRDLVNQIDTKVEDVDSGADDWGYAYRAIRGKTSGYSNHSSGTAVDINAEKHPLGKRGTWSKSQIAAIREILKRYNDPKTGKCILRWGEDYIVRKDGMHFEIHKADAAAVSRVVANLGKVVTLPFGQAEVRLRSLDELPLKKRVINYAALLWSVKSRAKTESCQTFQAALGGLNPDGLWGVASKKRFREVLAGRGWAVVDIPSRDHVYWLTKGKVKGVS